MVLWTFDEKSWNSTRPTIYSLNPTSFLSSFYLSIKYCRNPNARFNREPCSFLVAMFIHFHAISCHYGNTMERLPSCRHFDWKENCTKWIFSVYWPRSSNERKQNWGKISIDKLLEIRSILYFMSVRLSVSELNLVAFFYGTACMRKCPMKFVSRLHAIMHSF